MLAFAGSTVRNASLTDDGMPLESENHVVPPSIERCTPLAVNAHATVGVDGAKATLITSMFCAPVVAAQVAPPSIDRYMPTVVPASSVVPVVGLTATVSTGRGNPPLVGRPELIAVHVWPASVERQTPPVDVAA